MKYVILFLFGLLFVTSPTPGSAAQREQALFAGGCFWCMEAPFDGLPGVVSVISGYTGGRTRSPTYQEVSAGGTGHVEAVQILFDPAIVSYATLLELFWHNIDPTVSDRQFCDVGTQYRGVIFYRDDVQRRLAQQSKERLDKNKPFRQPVVTELLPAAEFYPAEEYHQHYYKKNPLRYRYYRAACGRDQRLKELWGRSAGH